jgi:HNH endonuclease
VLCALLSLRRGPGVRHQQCGAIFFWYIVSISKGTRFRIFQRDDFSCQYCGRRAPDVTLEPDHIVPKSQGGPDDMDNLVTACFDCNRGKSDRPLQPQPQNPTHVKRGYVLCWLVSVFGPDFQGVTTHDIEFFASIQTYRLYDTIIRTKIFRETSHTQRLLMDPIGHMKGLLELADGEKEEQAA